VCQPGGGSQAQQLLAGGEHVAKAHEDHAQHKAWDENKAQVARSLPDAVAQLGLSRRHRHHGRRGMFNVHEQSKCRSRWDGAEEALAGVGASVDDTPDEACQPACSHAGLELAACTLCHPSAKNVRASCRISSTAPHRGTSDIARARALERANRAKVRRMADTRGHAPGDAHRGLIIYKYGP
jgi:hypothetical protein